MDRAYRIGQPRDVVVYRLVTCGTVEEKIYRKQVRAPSSGPGRGDDHVLARGVTAAGFTWQHCLFGARSASRRRQFVVRCRPAGF